MDYRFGGISYPSFDDMVKAIAVDFMTAGGMNDDACVRDLFSTTDDDTVFAQEAFDHWEMPEGLDVDGLAKAIGEYREEVSGPALRKLLDLQWQVRLEGLNGENPDFADELWKVFCEAKTKGDLANLLSQAPSHEARSKSILRYLANELLPEQPEGVRQWFKDHGLTLGS